MSVRQFTLTALCSLALISCDKEKKNTSQTTSTSTSVESTSDKVESSETEAPFSVKVEEDLSFEGLPSLQSFVLATSNDRSKWLMFAGRNNGMHDFGNDNYEEKSFPVQHFNDQLYVYDIASKELSQMPADDIEEAMGLMFKATNLQHLQKGNALYITGGYGENILANSDETLERWTTYSYMAKIDVDGMIKAIEEKNKTALNASILWGEDEAVRATGGELFQIDDYFYLAGGHVYKGIFSLKKDGSITPTSQTYLDAVHRFKLSEKNGKLVLSDLTKVTDGKPDNETQFRRRDLPVTPAIQLVNGNLLESISMYAGVFTAPDNKVPGLAANDNWVWPIYIYKDGSYSIDESYEQQSNVYAAANFVVYDPGTQVLHTTILGGIMHNNGNEFSNEVLTINRPLSGDMVSTATQQAAMGFDKYYGAEANVVYSEQNRLSGLDAAIFDLSAMEEGAEVVVGHFYGGIEALIPNPGGFGEGKSFASNKVFKISITKEPIPNK